jgi:ferredoxin-type protein NapH
MTKPTLKTWRRLTQIATALAFIVIPWLNTRGHDQLHGNLLSFNLAGLPLADPLAAMQVWVGAGGLTTTLAWGAGLVLGLAMLSGTSFCAWLCPFGLLSEWGHFWSRRLGRSGRPWGRAGRGFALKALLVALGLLAALAGTGPLLNQLSLPGWYTRAWQMVFGQGHWSLALVALAGVVLLEAWLGRRLWCRYLCPQAWPLACAQLVNPWRLKVRHQASRCRCGHGHAPCQESCSLGLDPKALTGNLETACTNCGDCVTVCQGLGRAMGFGLAPRRPGPGQSSPQTR